MIEFHALGALTATDDGAEINLGGPRQRRLLAMLLIHRGTVVSADRLTDAIFAGEPTPAAATTLRSYVARLRKAIGDGATVVTRAPGYLLEVRVERFDAARFESDLADATARLGRADAAGAVEWARAALGWWRGEAYAEFADEDWARPEAQRLTELRLVAHERLVDALLASGRAAEAIPALETLVADHPFREGFRSQLAIALYRSGRQTDALRSLRAFRELLRDELGLDPSPALAALEQQVLEHDPALLAGEAAGQPLRGYRLGERLGTGRDGTVHAANQPGVDRDLVIRVLRPEVADDPDFVRSFDSTAHRLASLHHPAIVPIHDHWREPGAAYVVMRRMHGGTLAARLERGSLPEAEVARLVERVGSALAAAGEVGVAHGRLSPAAVLFDGDGAPYVSDFKLCHGDPVVDAHADVEGLGRLAVACLGRTPPPLEEVLSSVNGFAAADQATRIVHALAPAVAGAGAALPNPYKGLRAFDEADAADFFGRATLLDQLVDRLAGVGIAGRLVLVVGGSGTGKSSVVRAGLLPRLRSGAVPESAGWFVTTMLPDAHPWHALADGLRRVAVHDDRDLAAELAADAGGVDRVVRRLVPDGGQLLLVIDQFEELFTLAADDDQRRFVAGLVHALTADDSRLRVVATLRADFYDRPLGAQGLGPLVSAATVAIPAMEPAELEAAIVEPLERIGGTIERALVAELVSSVVDEPAALPSLQFALFELAERRPDRVLTLADHRSLGGVSGAIASRAEAMYQSLDHDEQTAVRQMFQRLVAINDDGEPSRRRVSRFELADLAAGAHIDASVDRWAAARLLTLDRHPQTRLPTVELAHEAMLREWPRLQRWIAEDRDAITVLGQLRQAAASWAELDRDPGALYRGARLEVALDVVEVGRQAVSSDERAFLDASRDARDAEQQDAAERIERQARANRHLRAQLGVTAVALVIALVGGLVALDQRGDAEREGRIATARELAAASDASLEDDAELSTLLALAAVEESRAADGTVLPEVQGALHRAVTASRLVLRVPGVGGALDWSPDGSVFVTEGPEESGIIDLRDTTTGESIRSWTGHEPDVNEVAFGPHGAQVATVGDDGALRVWEVATGDLELDVSEPELSEVVWAPEFSPDGSLVAAGWLESSVVLVLDVATGAEVSRIRAGRPMSTAFSPDGRRITVADDGSPVVADVLTGERLFSLSVPGQYIGDVAWSPDGRWIGGSGGDARVFIFDATTGRLVSTATGHQGEVDSIDWSPDSRQLASASADGTVRIWDVTDGGTAEALVLSSKDTRSGLLGVAFSPDGSRVIAGDSAAASTTVWDVSVTGGREWVAAEVVSSQSAAEFTPDDREVLLRTNGAVTAVDIESGRTRTVVGGVSAAGAALLALSADGSMLATSGDGGSLVVYDTGTGDELWWAGAQAGAVFDLAWTPDGRFLVASLAEVPDQVIAVFDRDGTRVAELVDEPGAYSPQVAVDPTGSVVAMTHEGFEREDPDVMDVTLWDWQRDEVVAEVDSETPLDLIAFDPTGSRLVASGWLRGVTEIWDLQRNELEVTFTAPPIATVVTFSPDGEHIVTGHRDGTVRVWDAETGVQQLVLEGHDQNIRAVAVSHDGTRLLSVGEDGLARVWALELDDLIGLAESRLTRGFTDDECRQYLHLDGCEG